MKKIVRTKAMLCIGIIVNSFLATAQPGDADFTRKYLGWVKLINPNQPEKPYTQDHRTYSAKQMAISRMLVGWIQQSYTPKGAIGTAYKIVNEKLGLYNQNTKSQPHRYGAGTKTHIELRKNSKGNWEPYTNTQWFMDIAANGTIGNEIGLISTPEQYYFNIPGEAEKDDFIQKMESLLGFSSQPTLKKYYRWFQPKTASTTLHYVVLLCKDNIKPHVQISKGEYLDALGKAIERDAKEKYKWIAEEKAKNSRYDASATENQLIKRKAAFAALREKYKNRLSETALLKKQPDMHLEHESGFDVFENKNYPAYYPVYKFDPAKLALCKSDTPQWIVISWDAEGVATQNEAGTHLHQSMLSNFDYDYIYNYFFYPEKVKGIAYKPLRSPTNEEKIISTEKSDIAKKNETDASVLFFDDFSTTPENKTPQDWSCTLNQEAQRATVKKITGGKTNWVQLKGHYFHINKLNETLPPDFTASFDVCVKKDFHWGTPGLEFYIAGKKKYENSYENYIMVKVRPGFDDRDGWATVNIKSASKSVSPPEVAVPGFSNNKPINRTTVTIKKRGEQLQVFIGSTKVFDEQNALAAGMLLDHFYFKEIDQQWEVEEFYITNIKIAKD